ncbi:four helix bundle protein [Patescibacteria group bacterium]|nr:four helix bundle protein [Patescibacteria group bacterium]
MKNKNVVTSSKIRSFTDLRTWKEGHQLVLSVYKITTSFPKEETYGLTNQLRRAAVSVTSNIAEGFNRRSSKEKCQFYRIALGSLTEIQNQLLVARDIGYLQPKYFTEIAEQTVCIGKMLNGLLKTATTAK